MFHRFINGCQRILSGYISYSVFLLKCPFSCILTCRYFKLIMWPNLSNFLLVFLSFPLFQCICEPESHLSSRRVSSSKAHPHPTAGVLHWENSANTTPLCIPQCARLSGRTLSTQSTTASFSGHSCWCFLGNGISSVSPKALLF